MFDTIIVGGQIIDGTRAARFRGDVGIRGDRIEQIGVLDGAACRSKIDARQRVVAPGFFDVHNHSDGWLLKQPCLAPKIQQGFTTEVLMADGISYAPVCGHTVTEWLFYLRGLNGLRPSDYTGWESWEDYMRQLDAQNVQNAAAHVPYANVRSLACGFRRRAIDDFQMRQVQHEIRQGMEQGAVGLSTGLDYIVQCHATTDELVRACQALRPYQGLYVTHIRYKRGLIPALQEAVEIGRRAEVPVHISHLKATTSQMAEDVLAFVDRAAHDVDLSFDVYPYQPASTLLSYFLPYEVWDDGPLRALDKLRCREIRRRVRAGIDASGYDLDAIRIAWVPSREHTVLHGMRLGDYVRQSGLALEDAICDLLIEERLAVLCVFEESDEHLVEPFLQHPLSMIGSDGIFFPDGAVHPRVYGTVGRLLGPFVRQRKLMSLEEAIYKLSGHAAKRFGFPDRGVLRDGASADLVVFDPETITDHATFDEPHQPTTGITDVLVNGSQVVRDRQLVTDLPSRLPGKFLRRGG